MAKFNDLDSVHHPQRPGKPGKTARVDDDREKRLIHNMDTNQYGHKYRQSYNCQSLKSRDAIMDANAECVIFMWILKMVALVLHLFHF